MELKGLATKWESSRCSSTGARERRTTISPTVDGWRCFRHRYQRAVPTESGLAEICGGKAKSLPE